MIKTALAVLVASTTAAVADPQELTESSPSTLEPAEVRVGLFDVGVGLWGHKLLERIEVSSRHLVWGLWAVGAPAYDARIKFEFWREDDLSLSVGIGHTRVDLAPVVGMDEMSSELVFKITPIEGWAAYRITDRTRITSGVVYTAVSLGGKTEEGPVDELGGAVGTSNLEVHATLQHRVSRHWTLVGGGRMLAYQKQWAEARAAEMVGDEGQGEVSNTTRVEGDALGVGRTFTVGVAAHYARAHFNLRLGLDAGNYHLPIVNFVLPQRGVLPTLDMYWRF